MSEPRFKKCYDEGSNVRESNSTTPSGMRPETAAYLQSVIDTHRKGYRHSRHAGWNEARAYLAVEILEMEGVKHE